MKHLIWVTLFMVVVSVTLILYQWWDFQFNIEKEGNIQIMIDLYENDQQLAVQMEISNLKKGEYSIIKPTNTADFKCYINEKEICDTNKSNISLEQSKTIIISYDLLTNEDQRYFTYWYPQIRTNDQLIQAEVDLSITSETDRLTTWYSYKEPDFAKDLEHINYKKWRFKNKENIPLVRLNGEYRSYFMKDQVHVITSIPLELDPFEDLFSRFEDIRNHIFVIDPELGAFNEEGVSFLNHTEKRKIVSSLLMTHLLRQIDSIEGHEVLLDVVTNYFYSNDVKSKLAQFMVDELKQSLAKNKKEQWLDYLKSSNHSANSLAGLLDESLNQIDIQTAFFTQNMLSTQDIPFYEIDPRLIIDPFQDKVNWLGILYRGQSYLPLNRLIEVFGLNLIKTSQEEILIIDGVNRYRFYPKRNMYIINEITYQFHNDLLVNINNQLYIKTSGASRILPFSIQLNEDKILLTH